MDTSENSIATSRAELAHKATLTTVRRDGLPMMQLIDVVDFQNTQFRKEFSDPSLRFEEHIVLLARYSHAMDAAATLASKYLIEYQQLSMNCQDVAPHPTFGKGYECPTSELRGSMMRTQTALRVHLYTHCGTLLPENRTHFGLDKTVEANINAMIDDMQTASAIAELLDEIQSLIDATRGFNQTAAKLCERGLL